MRRTTTTPRSLRSTTVSLVRHFAFALGLAGVLVSGLAASGGALAQAHYDPPRFVDSNAATADPSALLRQLLPSGITLLHAPQTLSFGANERGTLLVFATTGPPRGYAVWYLAAADGAGQSRLIRLRDPEPADEYVDMQVRAVFSAGADGDKHIVVLDSASRAAPAGGTQQQGGSVWRRVGGSAQRLHDESRSLNGVADAAAARARLAPALKLPAATLLPGTLPAAFMTLPVRVVDLTRRERLERVRVNSRWLQANDPANGFLDIRGDAGLPGYRLAQFKRSDKTTVVALQRSHPQSQLTWFLQVDGGTWRDVSATLLPNYRIDAAYELPHRGTVLQVQGEAGWRWSGAGFESR